MFFSRLLYVVRHVTNPKILNEVFAYNRIDWHWMPSEQELEDWYQQDQRGTKRGHEDVIRDEASSDPESYDDGCCNCVVGVA